jgi:hypothetical protein
MMFFNCTGYIALHERMIVNYELNVAVDNFKVLLQSPLETLRSLGQDLKLGHPKYEVGHFVHILLCEFISLFISNTMCSSD